MGKLVFRVASDWQEVVRLRTEIEKLKQTLLSMDSNQSPDTFKKLNIQLGESSKKLDELVTKAAKAGAVMEGDFKKKIFDASQTVNGFTEKIITQKNAIKGFEQDLRALQEEYRKITKNGGKSQDGLDRIHRMKNIIAEEKDALFNLTQQQANARLAVKKLRDEYTLYKNDGKQVIETNKSIGLSLGKALGVIGGVTALKQLGSEIIRVRGEFQSMQTAIETMVGKDVAGKIMPQIKELAKISPLTMTDMVGAEKMMLGFNIQAEDTIKYLKALSDISMGESSKFNSLTLAFSQMSAAGKLMGQDLNQMINAGFNPLQVIAEKTGKSIATLKEEMSKGAISAEMVQQAFIDATSAGGKFYGMSENASQTINGQISMMQDAWDNALNEIGKSSEGFIMSGIQATTSLIQNYETIGKVLVGMIATYGVYRTALITNIALTRGWTVAAQADAVAKGLQTIATKAQTIAQLALNSAMKANPYVLAATLIMGAATAMWALHDSTTAAEKAQKRFNDEQERFNKQQEDRKQKVEQLIRIIQDETETEYAKVKAYEELRTLSPALTEAYTREKLATLELTKQQKALNEERDKTNYDEIISHINKYEEYVKRLSKNGDKLVNVGDLYTGIVGEYGANTSWKDRLELAENDLKKWKDALFEYNRLKKEVEENNKPIEVRLNAAKQNEKNIKEALETIDDLILTKKREVEGHEIKIPLSSEGAAQEAESLEDKVKKLKAKVEGDDIKIPFKPNEYLNKIPSLFEQERDNWVNMGMFTIPVSIELERNKITGLLSAAQKAVSALSGNSVQTYKEAYELAKKEWIAAKNALEESKKKSKDDYDKAKKNLEAKEKAYKNLGGITDKELKKQESEAEKQRKQADALRVQQEKYSLLLNKQRLDRQRQSEDIEYQLAQTTIDAMGDGFDKVQAQRELDNKKEIQALKRQKEDYIRTIIQAEKEKFDVQEELNAKQTKDYKKKTFNPATITVDTSSFDNIIDNTSRGQLNERIRNQEESWNEYLIKYGTFQQKKDAITRKYTNAINKAATAGEAASLQKEWEESLSNLDLSKLKEEINWEMIFGDLSKVTKDQLTKIKKQLQEFKKSPEFQNATPEQIQVIEGAINSINDAMVDKGGFFGGMTDSVKELKIATEELKRAEEELAEANKKGTEAEKEEAQKKVNQAKNRQQNAQTNVEKSSDKAIQHLTAVGDAIAQLGSSAELSLSSFGNAAANIVDTFSEAGSKIGGLIGAIFSILEGIQKQGLDGFVSNIIGNIAGAVGGILDTLTFGVFGLKGADYSEYNEMVAKYDSLLDVWDQLLDKKKAYIKESYGPEATKVGQEALDLLNSEREITKELASSRLDAGKSAGSHSMNYRMWKGSYDYNGLKWKDVAPEISNALGGVDFSSMWSMLNMSSEQLEWIKTNYSGLWAHMDGDFKGYLENIIQYGDTEKEIIESINEQLTQTSFDSLFDGFLNTLMDMNASSKDFADNFEEYMRKAIFTSMFAKNYEGALEEWHKAFAKANDKEGGITAGDVKDLKNQWDDIVNGALADREAWEKIVGSSSESTSQSSTSKGFTAMSQDTGEELNGRFTALQIAGEEIKNQNALQTQSLNILTVKADAILSVNTDTRNIADEIRTIQVNSYLELQEIRENTGAIVKPIQQIQKDIAEVKKNTKGLS